MDFLRNLVGNRRQQLTPAEQDEANLQAALEAGIPLWIILSTRRDQGQPSWEDNSAAATAGGIV